jgi:hypothetical protein
MTRRRRAPWQPAEIPTKAHARSGQGAAQAVAAVRSRADAPPGLRSAAMLSDRAFDLI